jgi:hypothetical protein
MVSDGLWPAGPWQALQTIAVGAVGATAGVGDPAPAGPTTATRLTLASAARRIPRIDRTSSNPCRQPSTSAQMLARQPIGFRATAALARGVSFCSIWTTLPFSIL